MTLDLEIIFLGLTSKAEEKKVNKLDFIKIKNFS